ncbi:hypothetical protein CRG98_005747 [Punica granatum]|uniref:Reverse transcriptase domain-containing protein n=1 Tax=Punica granatum TaxID=22663 RepID=A0A2I0KZH8_PUNGR|nr:hypothetical protein CRG98_005747 [Punica granatum]
MAYKIITKMLVRRLRPFLNYFMSPFQSSYIPGQQVSDNVVLLREVHTALRNKQAQRGVMIIKLDFEKAFDRIEWDFLHNALHFFKFLDAFVQLVMKCVSSSKMNVLFNGGKLSQFFPSRDIRQGDPLSPILFTLAMEILSLLIEQEVDRGTWKGHSWADSKGLGCNTSTGKEIGWLTSLFISVQIAL